MCCIKRVVVLCGIVCSLAFSLERSVALEGLPRYDSSPARLLQPAFGFQFETLAGLNQRRYEAAAEFGKEFLRAGFVYDFLVLDSLFRQSYSELDLGYSFSYFIAGVGYGVSMEWIPEENLWVRHRFKVGGAFEWRQMYLGGLLDGWFDELAKTAFAVGGGVKVGESFDLFFQWNGKFLNMGCGFRADYVHISSLYQFPGFGAEFSLGVLWDAWGLDIFYGFTNESFHRFGLSISKKVRKKTIL